MFGMISNNMKIIEKSLDASWLRNEVIAENIANVDTPGYKKKTVSFEEYLNDAMDGSSFEGFKTDNRHVSIGGSEIDSINPKIQTDNANTSIRLDGNNVDIESEMAASAENYIKYNTLIQSLNASYKRLITVINEGRK